MPVSTGSLGEPRAKRCKLCDESNHRSESGSGFWQLQLDRDLVDTISAIYPEWFQNNMAEGGQQQQQSAAVAAAAGGTQRESPPKAVIDTSPLHIDQNKESLKVKLMLRRPFEQLVAQGIMPPHKTPAAYHGQRRQLERAKTGDMLKAKIQQRPPRQELERRHILEADPGHVDPSLAERQRMLKKARLADQLNDQLSHRPGPLELIQKNILHTEETIEQAVKTGRIPYKATSEGQLNRPQHPISYITPEEDSQSSEGDNIVSPSSSSDVLETAAKSAGIVVSLIPAAVATSSDGGTVLLAAATANAAPTTTVKDNVLNNNNSNSSNCSSINNNNSEIVFADLCRSVAAPLFSNSNQTVNNAASSPAASLVSSTSTLSPLSSVASPVPSVVSPAPPPPPTPVAAVATTILTPRPIQSPVIVKSDAPGKDKNRKKCKSKTAPKARTIKFHEYKGPPSAQKNNNNNNLSGESSYDLLLKQQTLLLQFQLQLQHKYPQIILPASQKTSSESNNIANNLNNNNNNNNNSSNNINLTNPLPSPAPSTSSDSSTTPTRLLTGRLEDMKVSDLKAELKRRNLPVSGPKPQLIERLKPFTTSSNNDVINQNMVATSIDSSNSSGAEQSHNSPMQQQYLDGGSPQSIIKEESVSSTIDHHQQQMDIGDPLSPLSQQQQPPQFDVNQKSSAEDIVREQQRQIEQLQRELTLSKLKLQEATRQEPKAQIALQKHVQARQQQQQQQQHIALQMQQLQALQARQPQVNEEQQRIQQQQHVAFQNQKNLAANSFIINGPNATTLLFNLMQQQHQQQHQQEKGKLSSSNGHIRTNSLPNFINSIVTHAAANVKIEDVKPPPPLYEEATKQMNKNKKSVKSQTVDDVLEILIKNGELPPSAAQDPQTPSTAGSKSAEPVFPSANNGDSAMDPETTLGLDPNELLDFENVDFTQLMMDVGESGNNSTLQDNNNDDDGSSVVPMDTDDWLDSLCVDSNGHPNGTNGTSIATTHDSDLVGYDPLLGITQEPFDPFDPFNLEEFRSPADLAAALSWDKVDYAA